VVVFFFGLKRTIFCLFEENKNVVAIVKMANMGQDGDGTGLR